MLTTISALGLPMARSVAAAAFCGLTEKAVLAVSPVSARVRALTPVSLTEPRMMLRLDLVAVAAAVFLLDHVAGSGQAGDDAAGAALGDAQAGRDVAQLRARWGGDAQQRPGVAGQETPARHP
jgi:hypothetical protein